MTYNEYQIAASRTCVSLATTELDARHMKMGVMSEIGELIDAYKKELAYGKTIDLVNISEEWADVAWYLANEANRLNITLKEEPFTDTELYIFEKESEDIDIEDMLWDFGLNFKKSQHDNSREIQDGFIMWEWLGTHIFKIDTNKALENNIAKLKARYPDKFEQSLALNRNLEAERKELER